MKFSVEKCRSSKRKAVLCLAAGWLISACSNSHAIGLQNNSSSNNSSSKVEARPASSIASGTLESPASDQKNSSSANTPNLNGNSSLAARTPSVVLKNGTLQVNANNSDLADILSQVATAGGMKIDGTVPSVRVYGTYGPGNTRAVLTSLLTGIGYNFMMIGSTPEGVPSKLLLTARSSQPASTAPAPASPAASTPAAGTTDADQPGPGAIVNVPPAGPDDPQERAQQNLQRLQQMHDQQNKPAQPQ